MRILLNVEYSIDKKITKKVKLPDDFLEDWEFEDESELYDTIYSEIETYFEERELIDQDDIDNFYGINDIKILNIEEIIEKFSNQIVQNESCCKNAPTNANYCPTCGKKIKIT